MSKALCLPQTYNRAEAECAFRGSSHAMSMKAVDHCSIGNHAARTYVRDVDYRGSVLLEQLHTGNLLL